jgi:hypothetical protein
VRRWISILQSTTLVEGRSKQHKRRRTTITTTLMLYSHWFSCAILSVMQAFYFTFFLGLGCFFWVLFSTDQTCLMNIMSDWNSLEVVGGGERRGQGREKQQTSFFFFLLWWNWDVTEYACDVYSFFALEHRTALRIDAEEYYKGLRFRVSSWGEHLLAEVLRSGSSPQRWERILRPPPFPPRRPFLWALLSGVAFYM